LHLAQTLTDRSSTSHGNFLWLVLFISTMSEVQSKGTPLSVETWKKEQILCWHKLSKSLHPVEFLLPANS
jgi:hypothetical protein